MPKTHATQHIDADELKATLPFIDAIAWVPVPRCDVCGTDAAPLTREPVEDIVCERCPDCKREGLVP